MNRLLRLLIRWPTHLALATACGLGLVALAMMVAGVVLGTPLPVVAALSVAQGIGVAACLIFGLTVAADTIVARRRKKHPTATP